MWIEIALISLALACVAGLLVVVFWQRRDLSQAMQLLASQGYQAFAQARALETRAAAASRAPSEDEIRAEVERRQYEAALGAPLSGA